MPRRYSVRRPNVSRGFFPGEPPNEKEEHEDNRPRGGVEILPLSVFALRSSTAGALLRAFWR